MAKSNRKASSRAASKGGGASGSVPKAAQVAGGARAGSARAGKAQDGSASRWSRGKPVSTRKVAGAQPTRVAPAPLAIRDPSHEEIAHHAYLRWLRHGGSEHENWYAAEHELRTRRNSLRTSRTLRGSA